ncbi:MAG: aryl-sulfate sulfotransferase [Acidobacteria bacterium]|nr:aryl-sulfate sulfotransferase [Acidobacteriota bacterium]
MLGLVVGLVIPAAAVELSPSAMVPLSLGSTIRWNARSSSQDPAWYRFRARQAGDAYRIIKDFGPDSSMDWTPTGHEGSYEVEVTERNLETGSVSSASTSFQILPHAVDGPVVSPTTHPLVFLYSAPACPAGQRMRVQFRVLDGRPSYTSYKPCTPGFTMNFHLGGIYPETRYYARHILDTGKELHTGPEVAFESGRIAAINMRPEVVQQLRSETRFPFLLSTASGAGTVATDLSGRVVWNAAPGLVTFLTRMETGGSFWGYLQRPRQGPDGQRIRRFDLTGMILQETNAARVNEQLRLMGKREIGSFHHEVTRLPNGHIAALASIEQPVENEDGEMVDVVGDMIIVLDDDLRIVWVWDSFDWLDNTRKAILGETCRNAGACPPLYLAPDGEDWTHTNSISYTPDGDLLISIRHQDWLVKLAYQDGKGDGHPVWYLGADGDFAADSDETTPWFTHQHDANFLGRNLVAVFDNGNTRVTLSGGGNSRGQVWQLDEGNRRATLVRNLDLGVYAAALGSAQDLGDDHLHFNAGIVSGPGGVESHSFEIDSKGNIVYDLKSNLIFYRTFRVSDLYTAP